MTTEKHGHQHLKRLFRGALVQRVENTVGTGLPDVFIRHRSGDLWVENKVGTLRKDGTVICRKMSGRQAQYAWLMSYRRLGGDARLGVLVGDEYCLIPFDINGRYWQDLKEGRMLYETLLGVRQLFYNEPITEHRF